MTMKHPRPHRTGNLLAALAGSFALLASHIQGAETPKAKIVDPSIQGEEIAQLTFAPNVPPPITRRHATKVVVKES